VIVLLYGLPGYGKTTLLRSMVKVYAQTHLLMVKDHALEWGPQSPAWRGRPPENLWMADAETIRKTPVEELPATGVLVFQQATAAEVVALAVDKAPAVYVDDEIDVLARRKGWDDSPLKEIVHRGRHAMNENESPCEVHLLGACRRPQSLHTDLTDMVNEVYIFRVRGSRTLNRLVDDSLLEGDDVLRVRNLDKGQVFHSESQRFLKVRAS
jgi:hypothetical protein